MAPNKRGAAAGTATSMISKREIEARGSGTKDDVDTYDSNRVIWSEIRVFFTGMNG